MAGRADGAGPTLEPHAQLRREGAQIVVVRGRLREAAGLLPAGPAREAQGEGQGAGRLSAAAQQPAQLDDQVEEGGADRGAVQGVLVEGAADGRGGGQGAGDDGAWVDAAGPVRSRPAGFATEQALHGRR
ncbi:hypothetical protein GCM10010294_68830 [Streptomyces griseoloalbus]|nr:hypothetical protein GCM10010294_68830 [Streptomyces griseoloalbus]